MALLYSVQVLMQFVERYPDEDDTNVGMLVSPWGPLHTPVSRAYHGVLFRILAIDENLVEILYRKYCRELDNLFKQTYRLFLLLSPLDLQLAAFD